VVATSGKQGEKEEGEERERPTFYRQNLELFFAGELKVVTAVFAGFFENSERW
jgi:hypothetical protein